MIKWKAHYGDLWEGLPIDVMPVSNGEFLPEKPTPDQLAIMALADEETEKARVRFNMSRREFVRSAAAFSIGIWAINQVTGTEWGGYNAYGHNTLTSAACDLEWPGAQLHNMPGEFVFDVQSHHVHPSLWRATGIRGVLAIVGREGRTAAYDSADLGQARGGWMRHAFHRRAVAVHEHP